jgi:hypothetical protein
MANEITVAALLGINWRGSVMQRQVNVQPTFSGTTMAHGFVSVATGGGNLDLGQIAVPGWALFYNTDPTNYVSYGLDGAHLFGELQPLEGGVLRIARGLAAVYFVANTAACVVEYFILNN